MSCYKATILHIVNNYSGAARYAEELMIHSSLAPEVQFVYIYLAHDSVAELTVNETGQYTVVLFPKLELNIPNERFDFLQLMIDVLSPYIKFCDRIIVHDNGNMTLNKELFKINRQDRKFAYVQTLHFLPYLPGAVEQVSSNFDHTICVTKYACQQITDKINNVTLIYNGVTEKKILESNKQIRARYGLDPDEFLLLYVGRIESTKGVFLLTEQFCSMGLPNARLVVVGAGDYRTLLSIARANSTRVTLLGEMSNAEVRALMKACDAGVIPSLNEQCSYVALEMMSCGMPIIATSVRGMGELFEERDTALMVPIDCIDGIPNANRTVLATHIRTMVAHSDLRKHLGKRARNEWTIRYTAERMAKETFDAYKTLIK